MPDGKNEKSANKKNKNQDITYYVEKPENKESGLLSQNQVEQLKDLILDKDNNIKNFFEKEIKLQVGLIKNNYENIITEQKNSYEAGALFNYIKQVEEKIEQNDKGLQFLTEQQTERMKELIRTKSDNLKSFFEEAIRLQLELIRNNYEVIISEQKEYYENEVKSREEELNNLYNQKIENLKTSYELESEKKSFESYRNAKNEFDSRVDELYDKYNREKQELTDYYNKIISDLKETSFAKEKLVSDEVYQKTKAECDGYLNETISRLQNENEQTVNGYEKAIAELKADYENQLEQQNADLCYSKEEYEKAIEDFIAKANEEKKEICDSYERLILEEKEFSASVQLKSESERNELCEKYENLQKSFDEEKNNIRNEYENQIRELKLNLINIEDEYNNKKSEIEYWHNKNMEAKLRECQNFYEKDVDRRCRESYENGKNEAALNFEDELKNKDAEMEYRIKEAYENGKNEAALNFENELKNKDAEMEYRIKEAYENGKKDTENWHKEVMKQQLETQAKYFEEEIQNSREKVKAEMFEQMDNAARRNEEELKLFQDYYEEKLKPFKGLIRIKDTTDKKIKDIQNKLNHRFNKTFGKKGEK